MQIALTLVVLAGGPSGASGLTDYPGFRRPEARIEAIVDRGPIQELIVKCGGGTAIISYSKVERKFCGPKLDCNSRIGPVLQRACNPGHVK